MSIPSGVPTEYVTVVAGKGGPDDNAINVREDLGGEVTGWLKNGTKIRIVKASYAGVSKYRKTYNGTLWVQFDIYGKDLVPGKDGWAEFTGHMASEPTPEPEPEPEPGDEITFEVLAEAVDWVTGKKYLKVKKS